MPGCTSCGAEPVRAEARFCDRCGASLSVPPPAEFKPVTVLFADVVRSMDIAAAVGPERLREIMAELVDRSAAVVQRYGGTTDKFTGDGIMAVFGAPVTLEDHAIRAGLAALGIQTEARDLARTVLDSDRIELQLRVGLNSGQVIAGEIGSGAGGYTAIGAQVGLAQRMESVAEPGTVMVSESTARLISTAAVLGDPQLVEIKGATAPVPARRLLEIRSGQSMAVGDLPLVGRNWESGAVVGILDRTISGRGGVLGVVGPPGIGKSRLAREAAVAAGRRGMDVVWTHCESHTSDVPFRVVSQLLTAATRIDGLEPPDARALISAGFADAEELDIALIEDLLGVRDPAAPPPNVAADARRRRVTSTIKAATVANTNPVLYIVEDVQWIDEVSESMLADFFTVIAQTPTMVLVTYRPEYTGALSRISGMATIAVAPLDDSEIVTLIGGLVGRDPSTAAVTAAIVARVDGNPFFAQEIVRDLAERGVLEGRRGDYTCESAVADVQVPVTLQATIGARIDRLPPAAKRALSAAAVIGTRFDVDLLEGLGVEPVIDDLVRAELVDQVRFSAPAQYAFRHPLIRTVAYEAQLVADRAATHRRLAAAIRATHPDALDENAALIAEHLEAAGAAVDAYDWHMRAGAWSFGRDSTAAQASWERACVIADRLPDNDEHRPAMRIAPRTMLCASVWRGSPKPVAGRFDELRELCETSGDKASLAIGMYGLVAEHMFYGRMRQSFAAAAELIALLDGLEDLDSSIGVAFLAIGAMSEAGQNRTVLRVAQKVIDWAGGDPGKGSVITGSPLAIALLWRANARWCLGLDGWRQDLADCVRMARAADPGTFAMVIGIKNATATQGVLRVDDNTAAEIDEAVRGAESVGDDTALGSVLFGGGSALMLHQDQGIRARGREMMEQFRQMCTDGRFFASELPAIESEIARETARLGDVAAGLSVLRRTVDTLIDIGQPVNAAVALGNLVDTLLDTGAPEHLGEVQRAVDRLSTLTADEPFVFRDITMLRLRARLALARGDSDHAARLDAYRALAESLGFEGHIAWAGEMTPLG